MLIVELRMYRPFSHPCYVWSSVLYSQTYYHYCSIVYPHRIVGFIPPLLVPHKILDIPSLSHIEVTNPHQIPIVLPQKIPQNVAPKKTPRYCTVTVGGRTLRTSSCSRCRTWFPHTMGLGGIIEGFLRHGTPNGWFIIYGNPMTAKYE